jgi:molybdopterin-guanine dinucleotide biosynthesis protein
MNNLIGICGHHNSGKTTLIEKYEDNLDEILSWMKDSHSQD